MASAKKDQTEATEATEATAAPVNAPAPAATGAADVEPSVPAEPTPVSQVSQVSQVVVTREWSRAVRLLAAGCKLLHVESHGSHFPACTFDDTDGSASAVVFGPVEESGADALFRLHAQSAN